MAGDILQSLYKWKVLEAISSLLIIRINDSSWSPRFVPALFRATN